MKKNLDLPTDFKKQMQEILSDQFPAFQEALKQDTPTSIRVHPHFDFLPPNISKKVPWCEKGFLLKERPVFTLDPLFHAGLYYVQEASSMFVQEAVRQCVDVSKPLKILDLCAAPGGKTTLLADLGQQHLVVANEVIKSRFSILNQNLTKWGYWNKATIQHDSTDFKGLEQFFDVVLVDAPCSGEGLFRKDPAAMQEWSEDAVQLCAARQKRILTNAQSLVKPGGVLIYSTCTYNNLENKNNAEWLAENFDFETVQLYLKEEWNIKEYFYQNSFGYQFFPHQTVGEGFFISCFRKVSTSQKKSKKRLPKQFRSLQKMTKKQTQLLAPIVQIPNQYELYLTPKQTILAYSKNWLSDHIQLDHHFRKKNLGIEIGELKGKNFIPSHALALAKPANLKTPAIVLTKEQALKYLKKETFEIDNQQTGWHIMKYQGYPLGWAKLLKNRMNNYFPKEWRIRMEIK